MPRELTAARYLAGDDLHYTVAVQRLLVEASARRIASQKPQHASAARQIAAEARAAGPRAQCAGAVRYEEAALLKLWMLYAPKCKTAAVIALAFSLCVQTAEAVVVLPKGSDRPVMGYLVRQDERNVVVRQEQAGGKSRETVFARSEIEELIVTVSPDRLAELDPARPELYREYAEELAEKQRDPEARDAAIRLYAIAAVRGDEKLRHSALLGLVSLARSPEEERLFARRRIYLVPSMTPRFWLLPRLPVRRGAVCRRLARSCYPFCAWRGKEGARPRRRYSIDPKCGRKPFSSHR